MIWMAGAKMLRNRPDIGPRVVEVAWSNGDRYYGTGPRVAVFIRAALARFLHGRRS
jgi:hypothetical protein